MDFGSGYPADPKTKIFLENNWDNVNINFFRKTWEPYKQAKIKKEQRSLFDF